MASLTPLSKGLIALAVIGGMASAVWHLGLKERLGGDPSSLIAVLTGSQPPSQSPTPVATPPAPSAIAPPVETVATAPAVVQEQAPAPAPAKTEDSAPISKLSPAEVKQHAEAGRKALAAGDFALARTHLELAVQGGDGGAACHLGEMTLKGQGGIVASQEKAATLFQLAQSRDIICFASGQ
jgi:hypothetical protein